MKPMPTKSTSSKCPMCKGKGMVPMGVKGKMGAMKKCPECDGEGKMDAKNEMGEE